MTRDVSDSAIPAGKGKAFFDRADQVAETGNWDFAIELYLEGIHREPDNVERGHQPLRNVAMNRKARGGKAAGMMEQFKRRPGKDMLTNLVNAEYLLAKDPGSEQQMEQVLKAAQALNLTTTAKWIADILLESQRQAARRSKRLLIQLTTAFVNVKDFVKAVSACEMARQLDPDDPQLQSMLQDLSAQYTIDKGKYDQEGSFLRSVKDMDKQRELIEKDRLSQSDEFLKQQADQTRSEYLQSPNVPGKINSYVDALLKLQEEGFENEAIDVLLKAFHDSGAYQFKMRVGDVKVRQMRRRLEKLRSQGDKEGAAEQAKALLEYELGEYAERAANYPTDLAIKFDLGQRQLIAGRFDEAIASLQQAQRDPRRHVQAMTLLGQAFARKKWFGEAAETFEKALQAEMSEERAKELRYALGEVLEQTGDLQKAQEQFSQVALMDYNFKDVRQKLENIRKRLAS